MHLCVWGGADMDDAEGAGATSLRMQPSLLPPHPPTVAADEASVHSRSACPGDRCALVGHAPHLHGVFAAIAMWGRNACLHCAGQPERTGEGYGFLMDEQVSVAPCMSLPTLARTLGGAWAAIGTCFCVLQR
jgi:hypothetical protein